MPDVPDTNKSDKQLTELLTKLYSIQEDVGAKPKSSLQEKQKRAIDVTLGSTKKTKKTGSRFLELKVTIIDRLKAIHGMMKEEENRMKGLVSVAGGNNPKEVIARQAKLRQEISQVTEEWKELDAIYKSEARKRKSKFSQEDLELQQTLVQRLYDQIENIKEAQMKGFARASATDDMAANMNAKALATLDAVDFGSGGGLGFGGKSDKNAKWGTSSNENSGIELTDTQHQKLQQVQETDADFDKQLDIIGDGIQDLSEIAQMQNEEVQRQSVMLQNLETRIDEAHEHIDNINSRMKDTLDEVRKADKVCVDIMCIVMMFGFGAVLYQMIRKGSLT
mmetsp:Transcript_16179/g.23035  ORF Transcript_16179/g.23035 Transcript_16179/m.23035 type:complete len:335 (+) Transcript_16179:30-1034(+)